MSEQPFYHGQWAQQRIWCEEGQTFLTNQQTWWFLRFIFVHCSLPPATCTTGWFASSAFRFRRGFQLDVDVLPDLLRTRSCPSFAVNVQVCKIVSKLFYFWQGILMFKLSTWRAKHNEIGVYARYKLIGNIIDRIRKEIKLKLTPKILFFLFFLWEAHLLGRPFLARLLSLLLILTLSSIQLHVRKSGDNFFFCRRKMLKKLRVDRTNQI